MFAVESTEGYVTVDSCDAGTDRGW